MPTKNYMHLAGFLAPQEPKILSSALQQFCWIVNDPSNIIVPSLFEEKRGDIVFGFPSFRPSFRPPKYYVPCVRNSLLQFYADSIQTLQMFLSWSEDMHVVWILS